jgi:putative membrane-bound dehydrogenase-like protein
MRKWTFLPLGLLLTLPLLFAAPPAVKTVRGPLPPDKSREAFHIHPDLRIELAAAEPAVIDPVALAFDPDGKLWVVEMGDYPNGPPKGKPPQGRIRILEDRDGDGRFETSTVFADHLPFANGLFLWRDGAVVTMAPQIVFLRDTDGDGKADKREPLYEGFTAQNPQLRVSHPQLGLDGRVYVANGLRGGKVRPVSRAGAVVDLSGKDFRFDLLDGSYEALSGMGQFGNCFDDWGRRFVCDNRHHLRHIVLPDRYLKRNPFLGVRTVVEDVSELEAGIGGAGAKVYPLSKNWTTSNLHAGHFTAACGVFIYRGGLLPETFRGAAYTCDPTGNLVHRELLRPKGATFQSRPARKGVEFLATPDDWCRPVFLTEGPDGGLYVADMYRAVIEHPQFMPPELKERPDLRLGDDRGRVWRIVPKDYKTKPTRPVLHKASTEELVATLAHPGAWWRTTAQRLLLERGGREAVGPLKKLLGSREPRARVHGAWLLERFGALDESALLRLLEDDHPRVREQAVLLAEPRLTKSAAVRKAVVARAKDADDRVRYQTALSLGEWNDPAALEPLAHIALAGAADSWTRTAVATAVPGRAGALIDTLVRMKFHTIFPARAPVRLTLLHELAVLVGARREPAEVGDVLDTLLGLTGDEAARWRLAGLNGLAEGMSRRGTRLGAFLSRLPKDRAETARKTRALLAESAKEAADPKRGLPERLQAVHLLAHADWETAGPALKKLIDAKGSQEIRLAAIAALSAHARPEVPKLLMEGWRSQTPARRRAVTDALFRRPEWVRALLAGVESGEVKPGDIDVLRTRQLLRHRNREIRSLAGKLLRDNLPADRKEVLARYQKALKLHGDEKKGRAVFEKNCATCHRVAGLGVEVGPVISDTRTKTREALLGDILNPNQAIDNNYISYLLELKNGKALTGIIVTETASSITLKQQEGRTDVILRTDIAEMASSGVSLMPEGLEKEITVEQMADLLAFLKNWRYLDGKVPAGIRAP